MEVSILQLKKLFYNFRYRFGTGLRKDLRSVDPDWPGPGGHDMPSYTTAGRKVGLQKRLEPE